LTDFVNINEVPMCACCRWAPTTLAATSRRVGRRHRRLAADRAGRRLIATTIGLILGLMAGYIGGMVDDVDHVHHQPLYRDPSFVLLILISFSIGQDQRGAITIAIVIGFTSWVWTARAVRAQVFSLRNRDHVNLSKLSGHPVARIIFADILPYIASYVVMAFILQVSSAFWPKPGCRSWGWGRAQRKPDTGADDELGDDLPGAHLGEMVGLHARAPDHCADYVFDEPDEYRAGPGVQPCTEGVSV
jgi:hypothetical protein